MDKSAEDEELRRKAYDVDLFFELTISEYFERSAETKVAIRDDRQRSLLHSKAGTGSV